MAKQVIVLGTLDTKGEEVAYLRDLIKARGAEPVVVDTGVYGEPKCRPDISREETLGLIGSDPAELSKQPRGKAVALMCEAASLLLKDLYQKGLLDGVIGVGGSGGTTIATAAMRALPLGVPKVMVSTLASGNTRPHVGTSDIVMVPSICDISGLGWVLRTVLSNAASAIVGMVAGHQDVRPSGKPVVAMTMYGTTTPGVSRARECLESLGYEVWVFHASGVGGSKMEELIREGRVHGVLDMTLAEIGAYLVGGLHTSGPHRLEAAGEMGIPQLICPGAADTIVLPPIDDVPEKFRSRRLNIHNPTMTTMRTSVEENVRIAEFIAGKLNQAKGPTAVIIPLRGVSSIDKPGGVFEDPEANIALFNTLKERLKSSIPVIEVDAHIDDTPFAERAAQVLDSMIKTKLSTVCPGKCHGAE